MSSFRGDLTNILAETIVVAKLCMLMLLCVDLQALEGSGVVKSARKIIGATNPLESEPGTIRGDYAIQVGRNVIHGSDSPENGEREIGLWFDAEELCEWNMTMDPWLNESN